MYKTLENGQLMKFECRGNTKRWVPVGMENKIQTIKNNDKISIDIEKFNLETSNFEAEETEQNVDVYINGQLHETIQVLNGKGEVLTDTSLVNSLEISVNNVKYALEVN